MKAEKESEEEEEDEEAGRTQEATSAFPQSSGKHSTSTKTYFTYAYIVGTSNKVSSGTVMMASFAVRLSSRWGKMLLSQGKTVQIFRQRQQVLQRQNEAGKPAWRS